MFELDDGLWGPQRRTLNTVMYELNEGVDWLGLYSPTGSGKTRMAMELFRWMESEGLGGVFYVNRKLLIPQARDAMITAGLSVGVRAAEYDDLFDEDADFQVASAPTEQKRVYQTGKWQLHQIGPGGLVVVDEAHLQKSKVMKNLLYWYRNQGARVVMLTATPINMGGWMEKLIVSGTLAEWRQAGALVPVEPVTVSQPDMRKVKRNAQTGEFTMTAQKKKAFVQHIVGDVVQSYEKLNAEVNGAAAFMYSPDVDSSRWLVRQFNERGHRFIHIDATSCVIDGENYQLSRGLWKEIMGQVKDGTCKGLSSRFKLREGVDIPSASHCIFATPIGSLASYLQSIGRVMRASPSTGKTKAILQDHGGVYHSQGSPNMDRPWDDLWRMKENAASRLHMDKMREKEVKEPIRCPDCGAERNSGRVCWKCGYESPVGERVVMQEDGTIEKIRGEIIKKPTRQKKADTERLWTQLYYGYKNKKVPQSFLQMEAFFYREHGYKPTRDLPFMPRQTILWYEQVHSVPMDQLTGRNKGVESDIR